MAMIVYRLLQFFLCVVITLTVPTADAAVWQWVVDVPDIVSTETDGPPHAYLWIPPKCRQVRAVIVGQHNMEELPILQDPQFRRELERLDVAAVWITPPLDLLFRFDQGSGSAFDAMMQKLADESGYDELRFAPVIPIGHSAAASYPWNFAAWAPNRALACISVSGQLPYWSDPSMPKFEADVLDGIPGLVTIGEYEWAEDRASEGLLQRAAHPKIPLTMLAEPGGGHFDVSDAKLRFLALYLRKACELRLPKSWDGKAAPQLTRINPTIEGWLVERWHRDRPAEHPPAPVGEFAGDAKQAFWCFDEEMAEAAESLGDRYRGGKVQLLSFEQAGDIVAQNKQTHQQITLRLEPLDDSLTFQLKAVFLDTVPEGRPERWTDLKAGATVEHGADPSQIRINCICGPVEQLSHDTFAIRFDRLGIENRKRSGEIWLCAEHPGDNSFRRSVQQAMLPIPIVNRQGMPQTITFPEIKDCSADAGPFRLGATSDSGSQVSYYVVSGPAEVQGDQLRLTPIPPRGKYPLRVTIVAWQWGRSIEPKLQSATPVARSFCIRSPSQSRDFIHPGILHSRADLERMRQKVAAGAEPWKSGFDRLAKHWQSRSDYRMFGPFRRVVRDPDESSYNAAMVADGNAAYQNALMWCITGNDAHARKAVEILNAWAVTLEEMDGRDVQLGAGLNGFKFVNAAELMRATYPKWSKVEIAECQQMFRRAIYPPIKDFATFANGNWDGACIKTIMAIGVFCDNREMFDRGVEYFYNGSGNGRLTHYIVNARGQCQESGRDQGHAQLGLGLLAEACEIGWNQGIDMYGAEENRLLAGFEYTAQFLLGHDVPFSPYTDITGKYSAKVISERSRNRIRPIYELAYNHYANRRGLDAPFTHAAADRIRPEGPAHTADHPGFGTLLFSRPCSDPIR